mmetsp:Transcript_23464/g.20841  ORF Transcript_23464/g.20841 Transcript_23464/m.20841 type:complete len:215 (-) Transcript_23464:21-665(-)
MKDIVVNVLSSMRSTIELRFLELTKMKEVKHNNKFYQILGFDIMFDEHFNPWLFEVNAYPSMDIFYHKDKADGTYEKEGSQVDETVKSAIFVEAAKLLLSKEPSHIFELVYDSNHDLGPGAVYEGVFNIYKKLSGIRLGSTLSISKFAKLATYLPKSMKINKVDLELKFKKLQHDESTNLGLINFFTAMKNLADLENGGDLGGLIDSVLSNIDE